MKQSKLKPTGGFLPSTFVRSREFYNSFKGVRQALEKADYQAALHELEGAASEAKRRLGKGHWGRKVLRLRPKEQLPVVLMRGGVEVIYPAGKLAEHTDNLHEDLKTRIRTAIKAKQTIEEVDKAINSAREIIRDPEEFGGAAKALERRSHGPLIANVARTLVWTKNHRSLEHVINQLVEQKIQVRNGAVHTTSGTALDAARFTQQLKEKLVEVRRQLAEVEAPGSQPAEVAALSSHLDIDTIKVNELNAKLEKLKANLDHSIEKLGNISSATRKSLVPKLVH